MFLSDLLCCYRVANHKGNIVGWARRLSSRIKKYKKSHERLLLQTHEVQSIYLVSGNQPKIFVDYIGEIVKTNFSCYCFEDYILV